MDQCFKPGDTFRRLNSVGRYPIGYESKVAIVEDKGVRDSGNVLHYFENIEFIPAPASLDCKISETERKIETLKQEVEALRREQADAKKPKIGQKWRNHGKGIVEITYIGSTRTVGEMSGETVAWDHAAFQRYNTRIDDDCGC